MKIALKIVLISVITTVITGCGMQRKEETTSKKLYQSKELIITQITENTFVHTSYKQTDSFGYVPCNGLVLRNHNEVVVFDTPTNNQGAAQLIRWITEKLDSKIVGVIPTHFHDDCLGGLAQFHENHIPSYAYVKTIELARENKYVIPQNSFTDSLTLQVGDEKVSVRFFGEGHTKDNVVGYFPSEHVLFGGCLIKELNATKGYLGDANVSDWSGTVEKIKAEYPKAAIIVPGHGTWGDKKLLDYTITLFKTP